MLHRLAASQKWPCKRSIDCGRRPALGRPALLLSTPIPSLPVCRPDHWTPSCNRTPAPLQPNGRIKWAAVAAGLEGRTDKHCTSRYRNLTSGCAQCLHTLIGPGGRQVVMPSIR